MSKKRKVKCRNCSNILIVENGGVVCDQCFAFNEYDVSLKSMDNTIYTNKIRENKVERKISKKLKFVFNGLLICFIYLGISYTYSSKIDEVKSLYDIGQVDQKEFLGVIDLKEVTLSLLNIGFTEEIDSTGNYKLVYVDYDLDLKERYTDVEFIPYIKLESGEYIKPISSFELEERFDITQQQQFKNSITDRIDYYSPKGVLLFMVKNSDKPIEIQINESDMNTEYYLHILNNKYIMDLDL